MPTADAINTIVELSEGSPGVIILLSDVRNATDEGVFSSVVAGLRALGYHGSSIYMAYEDWARRDLQRFIEGVLTRDENMQKVVGG